MFILPMIAYAVTSGIPNTRLVAILPNLTFPESGIEQVKEFDGIDPVIPFSQVIASWNVQPATNSAIKIEVRVHGEAYVSNWYTMGEWSLDGKIGPRESIRGQHDEFGSVDTDTLMLERPGHTLDCRVTLKTVGTGDLGVLKLLTFSFESNLHGKVDDAAPSSAWGKSIDVPQRAQNNYPNGGVLCSATSCSMMLWHYANRLGKPEMNKDVPEVEAHVWDPVYKGAGNWPFNTAYMGSFPGMRAYVARFTAIADLEKWIDSGLPVICSVSFDLLRGKPLSPTESGHLVVLVGFTKDGDPVINDPAFKDQVRRTYKRSDFEAAWIYSKRTVYLVYPESAKTPRDPDQLWIASQ